VQILQIKIVVADEEGIFLVLLFWAPAGAASPARLENRQPSVRILAVDGSTAVGVGFRGFARVLARLAAAYATVGAAPGSFGDAAGVPATAVAVIATPGAGGPSLALPLLMRVAPP